MAEEIVIGSLIIDTADLDNALLESKKKVLEMEQAQKALKTETGNLTNATDEQIQSFIANETALKRARAEYAANQRSVAALQDAQNGLDAALAQNIRTQDQAIANNKELVAARRQIDTTTVAGAKAIADINAKIDANNKLINGSNSALEQQKNNVGNYPQLMGAVSNSFGGATQSVIGFAQKGKDILGEFKGTLDNVREAQEKSKAATEAFAVARQVEVAATQTANAANERATAIGFRYAAGLATETELEVANTAATVANTAATTARTAATEASTVATTASAVATNLLGKAMLAIPLFALLVLLAPLITFLTSTEEGMDAITSVTRPLVAIFDAFIGVLQTVGKNLFDAFSNPKKLLTDLVDFVKTNLINRFKAFAVILEGIINLDFKKVANGVGQAVTGVENLSDKIAGAAEATNKFLTDAAKKGQEIDRLTKEIERSQIAFNRAQAQTNSLIEKQRIISQDGSKTYKEREVAAQQIIKLTKDLSVEEQNIINKEIQRLKVQQSLRDTGRKGQQELADLETKLQEAKDKGTKAEVEGLEVIAGARLEAQTKAKEAADKALQEELKQRQNAIDIIRAEAAASDLTTEQRIANAQKIFNLENELARKANTGTDLTKALLENRQALSTEILAITSEQINKELELQKEANAQRKNISELDRDVAIASAEDLARAQIMLLDRSVLTERDYAEQVKAINIGKNESIALANQSFEEGELTRKETALQNERALEEIAFQIRMQDISDRKATENEIEAALLKEQYDQEQVLLQQALDSKELSQDLFNQKKLLSDKKYASDTKKLDKELRSQRQANNVQMLNDSVGALNALFGESKALSVASALINTYQGITAGVKLGFPAAIPAVAFAATTGFAAVKNILRTNKGATSLDSGAGSSVTTSGVGNFVNSAQTSTVATVTDRPVEQNTVVSPPVLVLESLLEVQEQRIVKINSD